MWPLAVFGGGVAQTGIYSDCSDFTVIFGGISGQEGLLMIIRADGSFTSDLQLIYT